VVVDADDKLLHEISAGLHPQMWQLHGDESPERVTAIRNMFRVPVIKAIAIASKHDVARARAYEKVADWLLFDAKPDALPGGNGLAFDWQLIAKAAWSKPWLLSGGLTPGNVAEGIRVTQARGVDVSSGVEKSRGEKDPALIGVSWPQRAPPSPKHRSMSQQSPTVSAPAPTSVGISAFSAAATSPKR
jgi:phosphoribosylanthranilate isomerase